MSLSEASKVIDKLPLEYQGEIGKEKLKSKVAGLKRVTLLKTLWYPEVVEGLTKSALDYLKGLGVPTFCVEVIEVPGSFEIPLAAKWAAAKSDFVVALGCVVDGETPHFQFVCQGLTQGLMQVQLESSVPIGFGVLTVSNMGQALERRSKGAEAAQAALLMWLQKNSFES